MHPIRLGSGPDPTGGFDLPVTLGTAVRPRVRCRFGRRSRRFCLLCNHDRRLVRFRRLGWRLWWLGFCRTCRTAHLGAGFGLGVLPRRHEPCIPWTAVPGPYDESLRDPRGKVFKSLFFQVKRNPAEICAHGIHGHIWRPKSPSGCPSTSCCMSSLATSGLFFDYCTFTVYSTFADILLRVGLTDHLGPPDRSYDHASRRIDAARRASPPPHNSLFPRLDLAPRAMLEYLSGGPLLGHRKTVDRTRVCSASPPLAPSLFEPATDTRRLSGAHPARPLLACRSRKGGSNDRLSRWSTLPVRPAPVLTVFGLRECLLLPPFRLRFLSSRQLDATPMPPRGWRLFCLRLRMLRTAAPVGS